MDNIETLPINGINNTWLEHVIRIDTAVVVCAWTAIVALFMLCIKQYQIQKHWFNPPPWRAIACLLAASAVDFLFIFPSILNYQYEQTSLLLGIHALIFLVGGGVAIRYFVLAGNAQHELKANFTDAQFALSEHREQLEKIIARRTNALRGELVETRRNQRHLVQIAKDHSAELKFAREMQQALLAPTPNLAFLDIELIYQPAGAISGDTYSIVHSDSSIRFILADAMGHGIPAALLTQVVLTISQEQPIDSSAHDVFEKINAVLARQSTGGYLTASWLQIENTGSLTFCGAGNSPLLLWRKGRQEIEILDGAGQALGMFDDIFMPYEPLETKLMQGDRVFLYTDGLLEWSNSEKEFFGLKRIESTIRECAKDDLDVVIAGLKNAAWEFSGMQDCDDDVSIIAMEFTGTEVS